MRKIVITILALVLTFAFSAAAQNQAAGGATDKSGKKVAKAEKQEASAAAKNKEMRLTGWVKSEGDKVTFVNDKDKQTWSVQNPDVLKPLDGKHVKVKAAIHESDKSLTIASVKEMRKSKQAGEMAQHKSQHK
ncbi:MAG TPA: hypothetical protein VN622_16845 [Clostridia bacterium]|nr:hypothetical protein [Clostridia bacterium]